MADVEISHMAAVIPASNMQKSIAFYETLGFSLSFAYEEPPEYAVLKFGGASVHLSLASYIVNDGKDAMKLYFFVHDIDSYYDHVKSVKLPLLEEIVTYDYGMREFTIEDPNKIQLIFGEHIERVTSATK